MEAGIVTKSEFAAILGVSPAAVSQYISGGKISPPALVGTGRFAKIDVAAARAQLRKHLDISQHLGNGRARLDDDPPITPREAAPGGGDAAAAREAPALAAPPASADELYKREKLREIEFRNRENAEKELARRGSLVPAETVRAELGRIAASMLAVFEGALPDFAAAISAKFAVPERDVLHELRGAFREVRVRAARERRDEGAARAASAAIEVEENAPTVQ